jgi:hemerythrin
MSLFILENLETLAFEEMNTIHTEEFVLVNSIFDELLKRKDLDNSKLESQLKEFILHLREHFQYEEEIMKEVNCPIYECHQEEHLLTLKSVVKVFSEFAREKNPETLISYFAYDFKPWLEGHINSVDKVTAIYIEKYQNGEDLTNYECESPDHALKHKKG